MVREMGIDEVVAVHQGIRFALQMGSPIKQPLISTGKNIAEEFEKYESVKDNIADKYLIKDEEGNPIPKDTTTQPQLMTDYQSEDEEAMTKELDQLGEIKMKIEFETVPSDRPVLITNEEGTTRELPLVEFLELSGSIDSKVVAFLNQYFIND